MPIRLYEPVTLEASEPPMSLAVGVPSLGGCDVPATIVSRSFVVTLVVQAADSGGRRVIGDGRVVKRGGGLWHHFNPAMMPPIELAVLPLIVQSVSVAVPP